MTHDEHVASDWWETFHVPEMADLFLVRNDEDELRDTIEFLTTNLALRTGDHVYDQCCGIGSLDDRVGSTAIPCGRR